MRPILRVFTETCIPALTHTHTQSHAGALRGSRVGKSHSKSRRSQSGVSHGAKATPLPSDWWKQTETASVIILPNYRPTDHHAFFFSLLSVSEDTTLSSPHVAVVP